MRKNKTRKTFSLKRLSHGDEGEQVRQVLASLRLSGLRPSQRAEELLRAVASGEITSNMAIDEIKLKYMSKE